jgi:G3E family GTPase
VGFADRLLLSKCDLVDAASLVELSARLQRMNPRALQQTLQAGRAAPGSLLDIGGFMLDESLLARPFQFGTGTRFSPVAAASPTLQAPAPVHDDDIASFVLQAGEVDLERIGNFVQTLIDEFGADLLRYKGILAVAGDARKLIFQGVQRTAGFDHGAAWAPDEARTSAIVLIGKGLPQQRLRQAFLATLATSQA